MKFDEVRPSIEEVFDHYGARILSGNNWQKAFCPLLDHEDKNASASVNVELGKFQCFSCDKRGDVFDIICQNESLGLAEGVAWAKKHFEGKAVDRPTRRTSSISRPRRGDSWTPPWRSL